MGPVRAARRRDALAAAVLLLLSGLAAPRDVAGQEGGPDEAQDAEERAAANECCLVLLLPVGARAVALGGALSATVGPEAAFANPAGLSGIETTHFSIHRTNVVAEATAVSLLLAPARVGTLGLSYQLLDFGEIEQTDAQGRTTGAVTLRHHLLVASYATDLVAGLAAGIHYKLYQFRIGCTGRCGGESVTAITHAIDAGLFYRPEALPALRLGATVRNAGYPLQVVNAQQADPLPLRIRAGIAYDALVPGGDVVLTLTGEIEDSWDGHGGPKPAVGAELAASEAFFLRAGYVHGDGVDGGIAVGVGMRIARYSIDVAKSFISSLSDATGEPIQVSFDMTF